MIGRKSPPLEFLPIPVDAPLTFDILAQAYLEDYVLQRYRSLNTARGRVEHLRAAFGGYRIEQITARNIPSVAGRSALSVKHPPICSLRWDTL
jgi:hypothetical protein